MKKILIWLTIATLLFTGFALAERSTENDQSTDNMPEEEEVVEIPMISGVISEINDAQYDENGKLLSATLLVTGGEHPQVEVFYNAEDTVLEGVEALEIGNYVYVQYNGVMTRAIPPQITAEQVSVWKLEGTVTAIEADGFMLDTAEQGEVWCNATVEQLATLAVGASLTVYTNGIMTLSLPAQVTAVWVVE